MKSELDKIYDKLKKTYKDTFSNPSEVGIIKRIPMSSPNINFILGGGFPIGKPLTIFGPESAGKSALAYYIAGQFQKRMDNPNKRTVVYVDMEHAFHQTYAETVGLNTNENFILLRPLDGEEGFEIIDGLIRTGEIGLICWDSVASTPSRKIADAEYGKASYWGLASLMSQALVKINPLFSRYETSAIFINQVRAKIGGMVGYYPGADENSNPGGWSLKFYSAWRGRVSKGEDIIINKEVIGNQIKIRNVKSKVGMPKRSIQLDLYYDRGFDVNNEYIDFIINLEFVQKSGAWLSNDEWKMKVQGREGLKEWFRVNPDKWNEAKAKVDSSFSGATILDKIEIDIPEIPEGSDIIDDEEQYEDREEK